MLKGNGMSILIFLGLICFLTHGKLLMTIWVARHGAREPNIAHNEILVDQQNIFKGYRLLTNVGMRQQHILGRIFRDKYQSKFEITPASVLVRSTIYQRTIFSSLSFVSGIVNPENSLFPLFV